MVASTVRLLAGAFAIVACALFAAKIFVSDGDDHTHVVPSAPRAQRAPDAVEARPTQPAGNKCQLWAMDSKDTARVVQLPVFGPTEVRRGKIPLNYIVAQHGLDTPAPIAAALNRIPATNSQWRLVVATQANTSTALFEHFPTSALQTVGRLSGAAKREFSRLVALYVHGGVAASHGMSCATSLTELLEVDDDVLLFTAPGGISPDFIAAVPRHAFVRALLDAAVKNISNGTAWRLTPEFIAAVFQSHFGHQHEVFGRWDAVRMLMGRAEEACGVVVYRDGSMREVLYAACEGCGTPEQVNAALDRTVRTRESCRSARAVANRTMVDMAARTAPRSAATGADSSGLRIPLRIMQADAEDMVPASARAAMRATMASNPRFEHQYYDLRRAREFVDRSCDLRAVYAFDLAATVRDKMAVFRVCWLLAEGGVALPLEASATSILADLQLNTELVVASPLDDVMAAAPGLPEMRRLLDVVVQVILNNKPLPDLASVALAQASVRTRDWMSTVDDECRTVAGSVVVPGTEQLAVDVAAARKAYEDRTVMAVGPLRMRDGCPFGMVAGAKAQQQPAWRRPSNATYVGMSAHHPRRVDDRKPSAIPRTIMQVSKAYLMPRGLRRAMRSVIDFNPTYEHRFFTDSDMKTFVAQNFDHSVRKAFNTLVPMEFKADLFRYCWLYINGGVYIDSDMTAVRPVDELVRPTDEFVSAVDSNGYIYNAFIASVKQHPILKRAIDLAVERITKRFMGDALAITGPALLADAYAAVAEARPRAGTRANQLALATFNVDANCSAGLVYNSPNAPVFVSTYPAYREEMAQYSDKKTFREYVNDKAVYADVERSASAQSGAADCPFGARAADMLNAGDVAVTRTLVDVASVTLHRKEPQGKLRIPRVIMQTNKLDRVPPRLREVMRSHVEVNPDFDYVFWSDARIRDYIQEHFDVRTLAAFDRLIPGAFRSDLFRYCWLFVEGGVYIDGDMTSQTPLSELLHPDEGFVSAEDNKNGFIYNAFMAAAPRHKIVAKAIELAVTRILADHYGNHALDITGPAMLRDAYEAVTGKRVEVHGVWEDTRLLEYGRQPHCGVGNIRDSSGKSLFLTGYREYRAEMAFYFAGSMPYWGYWTGHGVYQKPATMFWCPVPTPPPNHDQNVVPDTATFDTAPFRGKNNAPKSQLKVPPTIVQFGARDAVNRTQHKALRTVAEWNPMCDIHYVADARIEGFVERYCANNRQTALRNLKTRAYRVTYAALCFLEEEGGMFVHERAVATWMASSLLEQSTTLAFAPGVVASSTPAFIAAAPHNPAVASALDAFPAEATAIAGVERVSSWERGAISHDSMRSGGLSASRRIDPLDAVVAELAKYTKKQDANATSMELRVQRVDGCESSRVLDSEDRTVFWVPNVGE